MVRRKFSSIYETEAPREPVDVIPVLEMVTREVTTSEGAVVKISVAEPVVKTDPFKDFVASDFSLQTLIDTGNVNNLRFIGSKAGDFFSSSALVSDQISNIKLEENEN